MNILPAKVKKHTDAQDTFILMQAHNVIEGDYIVQTDGTKRYVGRMQWQVGSVTISLVKMNPDEDASWAERHDTYTVPDTKEVRVVENRTCYTCHGTGIYHGRGVVENGVFKGFIGPCYSCESKGYQNRADILRCHRYHSLNCKVRM